jgi:hypothetical protein
VTIVTPLRAGWVRIAFAALLLGGAARAEHEAAPGDEPLAAFERTPPRLSLVDGEVSFWREGAEDWGPARANLALAPGDQLYADEEANLEIQIGPRAFLRAGPETELGLENHEPDFLQFRVRSGLASLDLRSLRAGHTIELDTPNAAFRIERTGYYRLEVDGDTTKLTTRRGGVATLTSADGPTLEVAPSEQVVVAGDGALRVETYAAPELDEWDTWNYRRTDRLLDALSARYAGIDVYGLSDLDHHGNWRTVSTYGPVWFPHHVPVGWVPYGFGRWIWDPYYGWTWVDDAAWGWAPFHYGRWVHVHGHWAWAPGPVVVHAHYAPALVAFFAAPRVSIGISFGPPSVAWVPLGWGEPCLPWWGPSRFVGRPHWLGWGGPRVVNHVVIRNQTVVKAEHITVYEHAKAPGAVVVVKGKEFGRRPVREIRVAEARLDRLEPARGALRVEASPASRVGGPERAKRPPERVLERRVVATRAREAEAAPAEAGERRGEKHARARARGPEPLLVAAPERRSAKRKALERPPFGTEAGAERRAPSPPPRFEAAKRRGEGKLRQARAEEPLRRAEPVASSPSSPARAPRAGEPAAPEPRRAQASGAAAPSEGPAEGREHRKSAQRAQRTPEIPKRRGDASPRLDLPGEPANRVYQGRPAREAGSEPAPAAPDRGARHDEAERGARTKRR